MKQKQRLILSVCLPAVLAAVSAYNAIQRNDIYYQDHPVASIIGSAIPAIIGGFALYWFTGWRQRRKQSGQDEKTKQQNVMADQRYYDAVAEEIRREFYRPGLQARAIAETGGQKEAARALYIRLRVAELEQIEQAERGRATAEQTRRAAEDARARREQQDAESRAQREEERLRSEEFDAERARIEAERTASPYLGLLIFVGFVIAMLVLSIVLGRVFSN